MMKSKEVKMYSLKEKVFHSLKKDFMGIVGLIIVLAVILVAIFAPYLAPYSPRAMHSFALMQPPSSTFLFGTDQFGRDVLSRVIFGARTSLQVGLISVSFSFFLGGLLGLIAGTAGGWFEIIIMRFMDMLFSFPVILLAIFVVAILGPGLFNTMIAIGIVYTPRFSRIVHGPVLSLKEKEFIEGARAAGASQLRIMFRHLLPNVLAPIIVQGTISLSTAILAEAALSFLGLGAQPPIPSWGMMLSEGRNYMEISPWLAVFPGLAIVTVVLGFNFLGDALRDALDPRTINTN